MINIKSESEVIQSCLTLCDPMDYSLPGCGQSYTCEYGLCKDVNLLGDYLEGCSDMTNKSLWGYVVRGL